MDKSQSHSLFFSICSFIFLKTGIYNNTESFCSALDGICCGLNRSAIVWPVLQMLNPGSAAGLTSRIWECLMRCQIGKQPVSYGKIPLFPCIFTSADSLSHLQILYRQRTFLGPCCKLTCHYPLPPLLNKILFQLVAFRETEGREPECSFVCIILK